MAASGKKNMFNEATRVQMPAMVHLTRLGYTYFGKITEDMAGTVYDPDTNILINVFKEQFARLNPTHAGEAEQTLKTIRQELDNDDIGRSFYERLSSVSPVRLVDFENPKNNTYHFTAEFTCKRDQDEFRPDITLFVNGLPLVFVEVKKPNNHGGMVAESKRMNQKRFPNKKFRRFLGNDTLLGTWGYSDIRALFRNLTYYNIATEPMIIEYVDIQKMATQHLKYSKGGAIGLKNAVEAFNIDIERPFHHAQDDAYYTAKVLKKIAPEKLPVRIFNSSHLKPKKVQENRIQAVKCRRSKSNRTRKSK